MQANSPRALHLLLHQNTRSPETQRYKVLKEVGVLIDVEDHPNAVKLHEVGVHACISTACTSRPPMANPARRQVYDDVQNYYLVMECCDGGELFEHIAKGTVRERKMPCPLSRL